MTACLAKNVESRPVDGDAGEFISRCVNWFGRGVVMSPNGFGELAIGVGSCPRWVYAAGVLNCVAAGWCGGASRSAFWFCCW